MRDYIEVGTDFREVDKAWVVAVAGEAPIEVRKRGLSHNAAEPLVELVRIIVPLRRSGLDIPLYYRHRERGWQGLPKYKAMKGWLARLLSLSELNKPILVLQAWLELRCIIHRQGQ